MSREIDERIVEMTFDNQQFERGVKTTMGTLDKLKQKLDFKDSTGGLEKIQNAFNRLDFSKALDGFEALSAKFAIIYRWTNKIADKAEAMVKSLTIDPVTTGWTKYADITTATKTIMSATAKDFENQEEQLEAIEIQLSRLNWFTDETSYNLTDMTDNIGKFTSAGVSLDEATAAMIGISNWAGKSGAGIQQASRAMYNLSQSMGMGAVKLTDWMSIENANMATKEFKQTVIDTAIELGELEKREDGVFVKGSDKMEVTAESFRENLESGWFTSDVLIKTLEHYSDFTFILADFYQSLNEYGSYTTSDILEMVDTFAKGGDEAKKVVDDLNKVTNFGTESISSTLAALGSDYNKLGRDAFKASQEATTFEDAIEATKDAVSTGWMNTFKIIFGNYLEAKKIWTTLANELWEVFAAPGERRNEILSAWAEGLGRENMFKSVSNIWTTLMDILGAFREAIDLVWPAEKLGKALAGLFERLEKFTSKLSLSEEQVESIKTAFENFFRSIYPVGEAISAIVKGLRPLGKLVKFFAGGVWDIFVYFFDVLSDGAEILRENADIYTLITDKVTKLSNTVVKYTRGPLKLIFRIANDLIDVMKDIHRQFVMFDKMGVGLFENFGLSLKNGLYYLISKGASLFAELFGLPQDWVAGTISKINGAFEKIGAVFEKVRSAIADVFEKIRGRFETFRNDFAWLFDPIESAFGIFYNWLFGDEEVDPGETAIEEVADGVAGSVERIESSYKTIKDLVLEIIRGDWGNGIDRDRALTEAGYDNDAAQAVVNQVWSLQGAWKEGWEEVLDSYANTSGMLNKEAEQTIEAVEDLEKKGTTKNAVLSLKKQSKLLTMLDKTAGYVDEIVNGQKEAEKSGKKQIDISKLSLKKQQQLLTLQDKTAGFVPKTFTQLLSEGLRKFVEKLPTYVANIAKAAATLKIKITELASTINTKLGAAIQKVMMFYEKHKPEINNFVSTIKERITSLAGTIKSSFSTGWERLKGIFAGTAPVLEEFFVALMNFDWGTMWETIKTFFSIIGENIGEGAKIAIDKAKAGLGRIGGMFSFIYNTVMSLFGGDKKSDNPEEEIQELAEYKDAGPTVEGVITNFTGYIEKGELPDASLFKKVQESLSGIFGVLQVGAGALTTFRLGKLFKGFGDLAGNIGNLFGEKGILGEKGFWSNVEDAIKAFKKRPLVESIRDIIMSFAAVAIAIVALGYLPADKLQQGMDAARDIMIGITTAFLIITGAKTGIKFYTGLDTEAMSVSVVKIAKAMLSLAIACGVMFFAVLAFSALGPDELIRGLGGVAAVMVELGTVIGALTALNKGSISLKGVAATLVSLAAAVLVLYFAVQGFAAMGWGALGRGLVGVLVVVSSIGLILGILTKLNGGSAVIEAAGTILALAIAVDLLTIPVMIFAAMDFLKLVQGIGAVAAILLALGFATSQMNKYQGTWGGLAQNIISLIALIAAIGALCWVVNEFEVDLWKAIGIDLLIGGLVGFMGSLAALGPAFSNLKGVAVSALGIDIAVGIVVGGITAVLEIVTAIDTWIEDKSGGTMGFRAMARKVGDSIETVGESIGKAVTAIKTALGGETKSELEAGKSAGQVLVDVLGIVGEMYASTGPIDALIEWVSGGEGGKGAQIESAITAVASGFTNSQGILSQLDDSTIDKLNKLIPAFNALKNLVYVAGDTYYDSGAVSVESIVDAINDLFTTAAGMDIDRLTAISTGLTDLRNLLLSAVRNPENDLGDVFSDAFINFVDYGLQALADEFSSDYALLKYTDSASKLCLGLQTAIDTSRSGYERKARRIVGWICEQIAAEASAQYDSLVSSGEYIMAGLQGGLEAGARAVLASVDRIGRSIVFTLNNALKVHSPSRLTELTGEYVSLGLAKGMDNQQSSVTNSALSLADGIRAIVGLASQSVDDSIGPVITPVLDLSNVSRGAASMSGMFGNPTLTPSMSIANARAISMNGSPNVGFSDTANQNGLQSITSEIANIRGDLDRLGNAISGMQVVMNTGALVGAIAAPMDGALGQRVVYKNRRN